MMVATAAPRIPISGNGPMPKIISGSRIMLMIAPVRPWHMGIIMLPVACWIFSHITETITKMDRPTAMCEYCTAWFSTLGLSVNAARNGPLRKKPIRMNATPPTTDNATPCRAAQSASSCMRAPRRRAMSELTPTAVPTAMAMTSCWSGNTSETAVRASCEYLATKMLSTMLYSALISMEIMAGSAMEKIRGTIFCVPILFWDWSMNSLLIKNGEKWGCIAENPHAATYYSYFKGI